MTDDTFLSAKEMPELGRENGRETEDSEAEALLLSSAGHSRSMAGEGEAQAVGDGGFQDADDGHLRATGPP